MTIQHNAIVLRSALDWAASVQIPGRQEIVQNGRRILGALISSAETDPGHSRFRVAAGVRMAAVIRSLEISKGAGYRAFHRLEDVGLIRIFEDSTAIRINWP